MQEETVREQGPPLDGVGRNDLESTTLHRRGDTSSEIWGGVGKRVCIQTKTKWSWKGEAGKI